MLTILAAMVVQAAPAPAVTAPPAPPAVAAPKPDYQVGVTTLAEVAAKLGKPGSTTAMSDGTTIVSWVSTRTRVKGASFVPVIGLFAGGAKSQISIKVFTFGPDGLLKSFTSTDSGGDCNAGIAGTVCH